jgi:hypothetical protein
VVWLARKDSNLRSPDPEAVPSTEGLAVVGLIGFEVDSESAARDQVNSFGEAFGHFWEAVWEGAVAVEGLAAAIAKISA